MTVLTLDEIRKKVAPIAKKYNLKAVFLFGSYARGQAREDSDIDLLYVKKRQFYEFAYKISDA